MRSNWPTEFSVAHRFHMAHIAALIEEAHQHDYESALYHVYDCVLNFTALRTSNYSHDDYISIYPQAVLSLREDPVVLDVEPAGMYNIVRARYVPNLLQTESPVATLGMLTLLWPNLASMTSVTVILTRSRLRAAPASPVFVPINRRSRSSPKNGIGLGPQIFSLYWHTRTEVDVCSSFMRSNRYRPCPLWIAPKPRCWVSFGGLSITWGNRSSSKPNLHSRNFQNSRWSITCAL